MVLHGLSMAGQKLGFHGAVWDELLRAVDTTVVARQLAKIIMVQEKQTARRSPRTLASTSLVF